MSTKSSGLSWCPDTGAVCCSSDLLALGVLVEAMAWGLAIRARLVVVDCSVVDRARA